MQKFQEAFPQHTIQIMAAHVEHCIFSEDEIML